MVSHHASYEYEYIAVFYIPLAISTCLHPMGGQHLEHVTKVLLAMVDSHVRAYGVIFLYLAFVDALA